MKKISCLEIYNVKTGERKLLREFEGVIEAPNWLTDGDTLLYNAGGRIWKYRISSDKAALLDTGDCTACNNDHVPSPDGRELAISCAPAGEGGWASRLYILPMEGGRPRQVSPLQPSYLHGWSPDGELVYCAFRDGRVDICAMPASGGAERVLTDGVGYNDGPEYSPDGRHIWFNSTRAGLMQVFRMDRDGGNLTQLTHNERNNWFPHISPDGTQVVYLSFRKGDLKPEEHLPDKEVELWLMAPDGSGQRSILALFGGQGTINVNSWAPDSTRFAFVSYRYE